MLSYRSTLRSIPFGRDQQPTFSAFFGGQPKLRDRLRVYNISCHVTEVRERRELLHSETGSVDVDELQRGTKE